MNQLKNPVLTVATQSHIEFKTAGFGAVQEVIAELAMEAIQIWLRGNFRQRHRLKIAEAMTIGKCDDHFLFEQVNCLETQIVFSGAGTKYTI